MSANVRFWVFWNDDWVKITLRPQQSIELVCGGPCDEGYHWLAEVYSYDGDVVSREITSSSRDCDGPLDRYHDCVAIPARLPAAHVRDVFEPVDVDEPAYGMRPVFLPEWISVNRYQRDIYAEAMGY